MPTMPTWMRRLNSRATLPSRVKQRHAVAEFVRVDQVGRFLQVLHAHAAEHRAEDLFLVDRMSGVTLSNSVPPIQKPLSQPARGRAAEPRPSTTSLAPSFSPCRCSR
jgi:hypothetical protein